MKTQTYWEAYARRLTAEDIAPMREWVLDCAVNYDDAEDRESAPDWQIVKYVARNYDGGLSAWYANEAIAV
jgi:hypothetical protein